MNQFPHNKVEPINQSASPTWFCRVSSCHPPPGTRTGSHTPGSPPGHSDVCPPGHTDLSGGRDLHITSQSVNQNLECILYRRETERTQTTISQLSRNAWKLLITLFSCFLKRLRQLRQMTNYIRFDDRS